MPRPTRTSHATSPRTRTRPRSSLRPETAAAIARGVRQRLGISQAEFSARYHVPIGTLRDWEQNRKQPDAPALAYLRVIAREPDMVARALRRDAA